MHTINQLQLQLGNPPTFPLLNSRQLAETMTSLGPDSFGRKVPTAAPMGMEDMPDFLDGLGDWDESVLELDVTPEPQLVLAASGVAEGSHPATDSTMQAAAGAAGAAAAVVAAAAGAALEADTGAAAGAAAAVAAASSVPAPMAATALQQADTSKPVVVGRPYGGSKRLASAGVAVTVAAMEGTISDDSDLEDAPAAARVQQPALQKPRAAAASSQDVEMVNSMLLDSLLDSSTPLDQVPHMSEQQRSQQQEAQQLLLQQ
jgi:hypothetical protein